MKTRLLLLLAGLVIAQTAFGAVSGSKEVEPDSKTVSIALHRNSAFEKQYFLEIKTALDEAGYSTKVVANAKNLKGNNIDIGILLAIGGPDRISVRHNENQLLAKCMAKELSRQTSCEYFIEEIDVFPFMRPGDPIFIILSSPSDVAKHCSRYARGIIEGIEEYMDELD
jgi:hypothetical protein